MMMFLNPVLLTFISMLLSFIQDGEIPIVPLLCTIIFASLSYVLTKKKYVYIITIAYLVICTLYQELAFYLPAIVYMTIISRKFTIKYVVYFLPLFFHASHWEMYISLFCYVELCFAMALKFQYMKNMYVHTLYQKQRDTTKELAMILSQKNQNLLIQQEQEIRIATLDERNRIAREIHDNVGHLLSSSLLQIGAIQTLEHEDDQKERINSLRETLSSAMDSVRNSVHNLHAESLDLELMIQKIIGDFTFCEIHLEYDIVHPFKQVVIYHILAILKESLNNIMKHSNADKVQIVVREQPTFYQIIVHDNGVVKGIKNSGIGLQNIRDRIDNLQGYFNVTTTQGFKVFITLPKEESICEC
ncbi:sensor histidine kinase [Amedibacillus sp. YH-ame10]